MSDDRKLNVLRAIVQDYVRTSEPVGSRALLERHSLGVSAATVRNDMATLEEEGLITATEAIEPEVVAQAVLRAINDGTFWIMTHPRYVDLVKARADGMLTGGIPPVPHPI